MKSVKRGLDERVDARADGAFRGALSGRGGAGAVDRVVAEGEEVEVGSTLNGRPGAVGSSVGRSRAHEGSPASLHLLHESELTAGEANIGGVEEGVDVVLVRSLEGGEAVGAVEVAHAEPELALVDGLASSGNVEGGLLVGAGPVEWGKSASRENEEQDEPAAHQLKSVPTSVRARRVASSPE